MKWSMLCGLADSVARGVLQRLLGSGLIHEYARRCTRRAALSGSGRRGMGTTGAALPATQVVMSNWAHIDSADRAALEQRPLCLRGIHAHLTPRLAHLTPRLAHLTPRLSAVPAD